jgi:crotonyl-CoA carboxylase/reductase
MATATELGEELALGQVPDKMLAQVIRPERFGKPQQAFAIEVVDTPQDLKPNEVLV